MGPDAAGQNIDAPEFDEHVFHPAVGLPVGGRIDPVHTHPAAEAAGVVAGGAGLIGAGVVAEGKIAAGFGIDSRHLPSDTPARAGHERNAFLQIHPFSFCALVADEEAASVSHPAAASSRVNPRVMMTSREPAPRRAGRLRRTGGCMT